ncbi:hypothetical protein EPN16_01110 [bacterium]|nr:MAG: hypothetical protein EPN16_01110 [bacterium]
MRAHTKRRIFFIITALLFSGCASVKKANIFNTSSGPAARAARGENSAEEKDYAPILAVTPLAEKRGNLKSYGSVYKYLLPLAPYGTIRYERPDQAKMFNTPSEFEFNMSENLVKLLIDAVKKSGLFDNVILTPTPLESKADLILSGDIQSTLYEGKTYSYGLSFFGPALWCLGLPAGSSHKKLTIGLYLKKKDTGEEMWSYRINKEKTVIQGLYHNWGKDVNSFAALMEEGVKEAIVDMRLKLTAIPIDNLKAGEPEHPVSAPEPQPSTHTAQPIQPEPQAQAVPQSQPEPPVMPAPLVQAEPAAENFTEATPIPASSDTTGK